MGDDGCDNLLVILSSAGRGEPVTRRPLPTSWLALVRLRDSRPRALTPTLAEPHPHFRPQNRGDAVATPMAAERPS